MANQNTPFGLEPKGKRSASVYNGGLNPYYIPASYGTALYVGDPVLKTGTSNTSAIQGFAAGTLPAINKSAAGTGNAITGVIVGFSVSQTDQTLQYNPASTERIAYVSDDPDAVYYIQDDASATMDATYVGTNMNLTFATAGSTTTGKSGVQIDASAIATTNTLQVNILRLANLPNNALGANAKWEVKINNHTEAVNVAGI